MTYQPKGGMCAVCIHKHEDCSHLPFETMILLERYLDVRIVKCTQFEKADLK